MKRQNPFPGMNPYMEKWWSDVHVDLISLIRRALMEELPDELMALSERNITVVDPDDDGKGKAYRPDVAIYEPDPADRWKFGLPPVWTPPDGGSSVTVAEPVLLKVMEESHRWVEIRSDTGQLITVIEVLSPANKSVHRKAYISKRAEYMAGGVNIVELDFLRSGQRTVNLGGTSYQEVFAKHGEHYLMCVTRAVDQFHQREAYPCPLRQPLPAIRIPLRVTDPDLPLDLQKLINDCYAHGPYWRLDGTWELDPPLSAEDATWVAERLAARA